MKPIASTSDGPILEGTKTGSHPGNNFVEVLLRVRSPGETGDAPVQQWKVEREDGAFLSVGLEKTFRKELATGSYKIHQAEEAAILDEALRRPRSAGADGPRLQDRAAG